MKFKSDRHAWYAGWLVGQARRNGMEVVGVRDDEGNWLPQVEVAVGEHLVVLDVPEPDTDWQPS